jgi:hypothetical protein
MPARIFSAMTGMMLTIICDGVGVGMIFGNADWLMWPSHSAGTGDGRALEMWCNRTSSRGRSRTRRETRRGIRDGRITTRIQENREANMHVNQKNDDDDDSTSIGLLFSSPPADAAAQRGLHLGGWGLASSSMSILLAVVAAMVISSSLDHLMLAERGATNNLPLVSFAWPSFAKGIMDDNKDELLIDRTTRFGVRQTAKGNRKAMNAVKEMLRYMEAILPENHLLTSSLPETVKEQCRNRHELCCFWAAHGECATADGGGVALAAIVGSNSGGSTSSPSSTSTSPASYMDTHCAPGTMTSRSMGCFGCG